MIPSSRKHTDTPLTQGIHTNGKAPEIIRRLRLPNGSLEQQNVLQGPRSPSECLPSVSSVDGGGPVCKGADGKRREMNKRREKLVPIPRGKDRAGSGVETEVRTNKAGLAALKVVTSSK